MSPDLILQAVLCNEIQGEKIMRKWIAMLLALLMLCGAALAENADELLALEFEHFVLAVRKDAVGTGTDTIENGIPFFTVYQDYDRDKLFCSSMNIVWNQDLMDLDAATPLAMAQESLRYTMLQHEMVGTKVENARVLNAEYDELDDKRALSFIVCMDLDYRALGLDYQTTMYTLQAIVPVEGAGTYTFTIGTDDLENCQQLFDVVDSVRWKE